MRKRKKNNYVPSKIIRRKIQIPEFFNYVYPNDEGLIEEQITFILSLIKSDHIKSIIEPVLKKYHIDNPNHSKPYTFIRRNYVVPKMSLTKQQLKNLKGGGNAPREFFSDILLKKLISFIPNEAIAMKVAHDLQKLYGTPMSNHLSNMDKAMQSYKPIKSQKRKPRTSTCFLGLVSREGLIY